MPRIYTRSGDAGQTSLVGGDRVPKDDTRIAATGTIDELNAVLGIVRSTLEGRRQQGGAATTCLGEVHELLGQVQHRLFDLGAEVASVHPGDQGTQLLEGADVRHLEEAIDQAEDRLEALRSFILPGGTGVASHLHLARSICRRAERRVVSLHRGEPVRDEILAFLNRLSDLLFVLARLANQAEGVADVKWEPRT